MKNKRVINEIKRFWKGSESHNIYTEKVAIFFKTRVLDVSPISAQVFSDEKKEVITPKDSPRHKT